MRYYYGEFHVQWSFMVAPLYRINSWVQQRPPHRFLKQFHIPPIIFHDRFWRFSSSARTIYSERTKMDKIYRKKNLKDWQVLEFRCRSTHAHFYFLLDYFCFLSSLWCPCYGLSSKVNLKVSAIRWTSIKGEILFSGRICGADTIWPLIRHA